MRIVDVRFEFLSQWLFALTGILGVLQIRTPAWAGPFPLTLSDVIDSTQAQYPLILSAQKDVEKAKGEALQAQGGFDPTLKTQLFQVPVGYYQNQRSEASWEQPLPIWGTKVTTGWRLGQGDFPVYDGQWQTFKSGELRAGIEIPLLKNGPTDERRAKIQSAQKGTEWAQESLAFQELEITRQATQKYWEWLAAGQKLSIARGLLDITEERSQALSHRIKQGDAAPIEQTENQRALVQRQGALISAGRYLRKVTFELSLYLRDSHGTPILVSADRLPKAFPEPQERAHPIPPQPSSQDLDSVLNTHPDIRRFYVQKEQFEVQLHWARNQTLPKFDLYLGASFDLGRNFYPSVASAYRLPNQRSELKLGVQLEFPLLFRAARGQVAIAEAQLGKLKAQTQFAQERLKIAIVDSIQAMETAQQKVLLAREEVELARQLEAGERVRLQHGDSNLMIVNLREQTTGDAKVREVDALLEYYRAEADYQFAVARKHFPQTQAVPTATPAAHPEKTV